MLYVVTTVVSLTSRKSIANTSGTIRLRTTMFGLLCLVQTGHTTFNNILSELLLSRYICFIFERLGDLPYFRLLAVAQILCSVASHSLCSDS